MSIAEHEFRLVIGGTEVDYDLNKEKANQMSHGYSLGSAAFLVRRIIMLLYAYSIANIEEAIHRIGRFLGR